MTSPYVLCTASAAASRTYTCRAGQIEAASGVTFIRQTDANSKDRCAAECDSASECVGFDFTTKSGMFNSCRLMKASGTGDCAPVIPGAKSVCTGNEHSSHAALCYC